MFLLMVTIAFIPLLVIVDMIVVMNRSYYVDIIIVLYERNHVLSF